MIQVVCGTGTAQVSGEGQSCTTPFSPTTQRRQCHGSNLKEITISDDASFKDLTQAVQRYFDLMYDVDLSRFDRVFYPSAQLHGFRDGKMTVWPMGQYKEILAGRQSPRSLGSPREEAILMMDFASATQALVKVSVRINDMHFVDHLTYHRIDGEWLITSKGYSLERKDPPARP